MSKVKTPRVFPLNNPGQRGMQRSGYERLTFADHLSESHRLLWFDDGGTRLADMLLQRQYYLFGRRNNFNGGIGGQFLALGRVNPAGKSTGPGKQFPGSFSIISFFK